MNLNKKWDLNSLYTSFDSKEFNSDLDNFKSSINDLIDFAEENFKEKSNPVQKIETFINKLNSISCYYKLSSYCSLISSVDSSNQRAIKLENIISEIITNLTSPLIYFMKFIGEVNNIDEIINASSLLKEYEFFLRENKKKYKYCLSEPEEIIISKMKTVSSESWESLRDQVLSNLNVSIEIDGKTQYLPLPAIRNLAYSEDPIIRKISYESELESYKKIDTSVALALNSIKGEVSTITKLRGYDSVLDMTLQNSRMSKKTLDAMFKAIEEYRPKFIKYFKKKAQILGHNNGLPFYDLFAPIGKNDINFTYEEVSDFIIKNFYSFSDKLGGLAEKVFNNNWIDWEIREGKQGGAFCESIHSIRESRIMLNFSGSFNDVLTLAHELGHAYHAECLMERPYIQCDYTLPIAETASTFCETLIINETLKNTSQKNSIIILENEISSVAQTIIDIYSRFLFEDELIKKRENGPLSVAELNEIMLNSQKKAYDDGLDQNYLHPYMWIAKPHYYDAETNYYNFPYAYGQLFSKGLYAQYLNIGNAFIDKYDYLLSITGKNTIEDIAKSIDIDVTDVSFWRNSLQLYSDSIDAFCDSQL